MAPDLVLKLRAMYDATAVKGPTRDKATKNFPSRWGM
jgi:hypothetical protein